MRVPPGFRSLVLIAAFGTLAAALFMLARLAAPPARPPASAAPPARTFVRRIGEGICIFGPDPASFPVLACRACRVEKAKAGGFRIGALNTLVLDDVELTTPLRDTAVRTFARQRPEDAADGSMRLSGPPLPELFDPTTLRSLAGSARVSGGARAEGFALFVSVGTNRISLVTAASARISGDGLALRDCTVRRPDLAVVRLSRARLTLRDDWCVESSDSRARIDLLRVCDTLRELFL